MRDRRRSILALFGCAAATAAAVPLYALSAPDFSRAPDLRADPVEAIEGPAVYSDTEGGTGANRLLVRFDGFVTNVGEGPLEIRGNPQKPQSDPAGVKQYAWASGQTVGDIPSEVPAAAEPEVKFETVDSHNHFHLMRAMRYSLWNLARTAEVAPGQKVGFCLYDIEHAPSPPTGLVADPPVYTNPVTHFCEWKQSDSTSLRMGVSSGWRDVYDKSLAFQWVDVSRTSPGTYLVASEADPNNAIWEGGTALGEDNSRAFADQRVTVPGYVARRLTVAQTGAPQPIALSSAVFGRPGPVEYRIVKGPSHGTLDPVGAGAVTYRPAPGYSGPDGFTYLARDTTSTFPLAGFEPEATVSINAATPTITISGAPAGLIAGTSAQLSASVAFASPEVNWSVSAGSITPTGLFIAPATPPAGGSVTVRATSTSLPTLRAEAVIAITPVPVAQASPLPPAVVAPAAITRRTRPKLLSRLRFARAGRRALVATVRTGPHAGRVVITITLKRKVLGRCGGRVSANRTVSCKLRAPRRYSARKMRATARIAYAGRVRAVRRAPLTR